MNIQSYQQESIQQEAGMTELSADQIDAVDGGLIFILAAIADWCNSGGGYGSRMDQMGKL